MKTDPSGVIADANKQMEVLTALHLSTALNRTSGIEIARESQPNVILMNIKLAGINRFKVMKILR